ncbi:MAG TPA: hypothetical protein VGF91_04575 [Solirubrobacteraceae bacterium]
MNAFDDRGQDVKGGTLAFPAIPSTGLAISSVPLPTVLRNRQRARSGAAAGRHASRCSAISHECSEPA